MQKLALKDQQAKAAITSIKSVKMTLEKRNQVPPHVEDDWLRLSQWLPNVMETYKSLRACLLQKQIAADELTKLWGEVFSCKTSSPNVCLRYSGQEMLFEMSISQVWIVKALTALKTAAILESRIKVLVSMLSGSAEDHIITVGVLATDFCTETMKLWRSGGDWRSILTTHFKELMADTVGKLLNDRVSDIARSDYMVFATCYSAMIKQADNPCVSIFVGIDEVCHSVEVLMTITFLEDAHYLDAGEESLQKISYIVDTPEEALGFLHPPVAAYPLGKLLLSNATKAKNALADDFSAVFVASDLGAQLAELDAFKTESQVVQENIVKGLDFASLIGSNLAEEDGSVIDSAFEATLLPQMEKITKFVAKLKQTRALVGSMPSSKLFAHMELVGKAKTILKDADDLLCVCVKPPALLLIRLAAECPKAREVIAKHLGIFNDIIAGCSEFKSAHAFQLCHATHTALSIWISCSQQNRDKDAFLAGVKTYKETFTDAFFSEWQAVMGEDAAPVLVSKRVAPGVQCAGWLASGDSLQVCERGVVSGGIRCQKATAQMHAEGHQNVWLGHVLAAVGRGRGIGSRTSGDC